MANYNVDNIEVNLVATATKAIQAFDQAIGKGKELEKTLQSINTLTRKTTSNTNNMNKAFSGLKVNKTVVKNLNSVGNEVKKTTNQTEKLASTMNRAFNLAGIAYAVRRFAGEVKKSLTASAEFGENYNLFNVAMDESIDKGMEFQKEMSGILHLNISDTMRYQGFFKSLTESLGIAEEGAYKLSENLTKLTYDLSSLYNIDFNAMYTKLQSGMVGQTKPLRGVGIDVTQQTLQGYLDNMGIERNVIQLTQAEKVLLRYIAILDQSQIAHGDFAKTIESPSNQIRVFKDLLKQLYVWVGNVFIGAFGKVMPYINAFVMVLVEMAKTLAYVFGFDLSQYEYEGFGGMSEDVLDLTEGLDDVGTSADKTSGKLKKMQGLLGFNEINNIKTPTEDSGASGGAGGIGGSSIYDDLLGKVKDYDNLMGNVRTKASEIRDKIFEWLGFTYDLNEVTGEISNLKWGGWSEMSVTAQAIAIALGSIVAIKGIYTIASIAGWFSNIGGAVGALTAGGTLTTVATQFGSIQTVIGKIIVALGGLTAPVLIAIGLFVATVVAIKDIWKESDVFREKVTKTFQSIKDRIKEFVEKYIVPNLVMLKESLSNIWKNGLEPLWEKFKEVIEKILIKVMELYEEASPILDVFSDIFGVVLTLAIQTFGILFSDTITGMLSVLETLLSGAGDIIGGLIDVFKGFIQIVVGLFTGDIWKINEGMKNVLQGIKDTVLGFIKPIGNIFIDMINGILRTFNSMVEKIGKFKLPDWVPLIGGKGLSINPVSLIPKFATGGFPEDGLFFANSNELVGSFSNGKTAVANNGQIIAGIEQGVFNAMVNALSTMGTQQSNGDIIINLDSRTIAKETIKRELELQTVRG